MKYDVIIVGAGSAGCVLAARLSEDPSRSVLLLEAGLDYPDPDRLPEELKYDCRQAASVAGAPHNWSLLGKSTPQQGRLIPVPRGKVTGGSSAINHQIFLRGVPEDYDDWAAAGNDQWGYLQVLPYFRKIETDLNIRDDFHGSDGPIPVRRHPRETWLPFQAAFHRACIEAGFADDPDLNHPESSGVGAFPLNNPGGVRMSTALTYLNASRHRLNLTVRAGVLVRRVRFDQQRPLRATGVEVESDGEIFTVAGEQIILSGGAIASPQLLMLSGVGPADHLRSLDIDLVQDLPGVGQNLKNHPSVSLRFVPRAGTAPHPDAPRNQVALRFTAPGSPWRNDIQVQPTTSGPVGQQDLRVGCRLELPVSRGEVRLASKDPRIQPHLDYQFLTEPSDRERLRGAVRRCIDLFENPCFQDLIVERTSPSERELASDEALDRWMQQTASIAGHSSVTCRMGPATDSTAVVDQYCRVHGLENLRVVDASVLPEITRANVNATIIMLAERAADFIRQGK